jgi:hypothetical protein
MSSFTQSFQADCLSGLEIEGFWVLFSNHKLLDPIELLKTLGDADLSGWDNRNDLIPTNAIYKDGILEVSFYPSDIYSASITEAIENSIASWYLLYKLPVLFSGPQDYRFAVGFSCNNDAPLKGLFNLQTVIRGQVYATAKITPTLIEESNVPYNILRSKFLSKDSDNSIAEDKAIINQFSSSLLVGGLFNSDKVVVIK